MGVLVLVAVFIITLGLEDQGHSQIRRVKRVQSLKRTGASHHHGRYHRYARKGA